MSGHCFTYFLFQLSVLTSYYYRKKKKKKEATAVENQIRQFEIVHADKYMFSVGAFPENKFILFETHSVEATVNGNGNGILVESASGVEILQ